jgi:hypothetical protein
MSDPNTIPVPVIGQRVRLTRDVERYPHFIADAGTPGTVVDIGSGRWGHIAVRMDLHIPGAETWDNEVMWSDDEIARFWDDCEPIDGATPRILGQA